MSTQNEDRRVRKGTDLFVGNRFGEESNVVYVFVFRVYKAGMKELFKNLVFIFICLICFK